MSILSEIDVNNVDQMTEEDLRVHLRKLSEERVKRQAKQKEYNAKPEQQEKRKAYSLKYRTDPERSEKFKAARAAYMKKPEVKERMKAYRDKRNNAFKLLKAEAERRGIAMNDVLETLRPERQTAAPAE